MGHRIFQMCIRDSLIGAQRDHKNNHGQQRRACRGFSVFLIAVGIVNHGIEYLSGIAWTDVYKRQSLHCADFMEWMPEKASECCYDLVLCQAVLRHIDRAEAFLERMVSFTRSGGITACFEVDRELECDGLYIEAVSYTHLLFLSRNRRKAVPAGTGFGNAGENYLFLLQSLQCGEDEGV